VNANMLEAGEVGELNRRLSTARTEEILGWAWERFGRRAAVGTSFQGAGLVMLDLARQHGFAFPVFTLDTGLLFPETIELRRRLEAFLDTRIEVLESEITLECQAETQGPELWARDPDLCCTVRKVFPLRARLATLDCWITGLRREPGTGRGATAVVEVYVFQEDPPRDLVKLNPMAHWTREAVWGYIRERGIPYNPLHDRGYRSIGCAPCTRPTAAGEADRAGRWTGFAKVECGIHTFLPKKVDFEI
jgi:phosphoadenosine phosphosulfate reductase